MTRESATAAPPSGEASSRWSSLGAVAGAAGFALYPVAVFFGLRHGSPRLAALAMLAASLPWLSRRWSLRRGLAAPGPERNAAPARPGLRSLGWLPILPASMLVLAAWLDSRGFVLVVPAALSGAFLLAFGATLWRGPPMVERFARLQDPDLTPAEVAWCRLWTWIWCVFFCLNAAIGLSLAALGALLAWATYNGLVSYVVMGLLFALEYAIRKARFGRYRSHFLDRQLRRAMRRFS